MPCYYQEPNLVLAYKNRTSIPLQVKAVKKGNLSVNAKDYLDIEFDGDKQKVKGKSGDVDRSLIFVIVYIGEQLGDEKFYICTKGDIQDIILEAHTTFLQKHIRSKTQTTSINTLCI